MKRLLLFAVPLLLAQVAFADTVPTFNITQATVFVGAGSDNASFAFTGPGIDISGFGGINCQQDFCEESPGFAPGSFEGIDFGFDGQIFIGGFNTAKIGGQDFDPQTLSLLMYLNTQTGVGVFFPENPSGPFTACVPAAMSGSVAGSVGVGDSFMQFNLKMPAGGTFCTTWDFNSFSGQYFLSGGKFVASTVPEPSSLLLLGTGLLGIGWRKFRLYQSVKLAR